MWLAAQPNLVDPAPAPCAWYSVLGVPVAVESNVAAALACVDATYAAFQAAPAALERAFVARLIGLDTAGTFEVSDSRGYQRCWPDAQAALLDLLDRIVHGVLARLHDQGVYAIHAGAVVYRGAALIIAGSSGQGKTTLVLGLLRRGLGLLSDEFAVADPAAQLIQPYRRSLHIRPGTPELIPELGFLRDRPQLRLGGGIEWSLTPDELERALPGCLGETARPGYVLLLDGGPRPGAELEIAPTRPAVATLELLRGTWAASVDFAGSLARVGRLLDGVACARLRAGSLEPTLDAVVEWLEAQHD
ncbi:MAG TPA: hypothetical protein VFU22_17000 [Roseiflexaceae bacterium]|nr:hypothetical protein [Roseiflexaceae bacterium]